MQYLDEHELIKTLSILKPNNQLFEIRIHYSNKKIFSGYFTDMSVAINALKKTDLRNCNVYMTLNEINPACYDRPQKDKLMQASSTTSDNNITGIDWLMIDLDPNRPKDTSSSNEQFNDAKLLGNKVYDFLKKQGFEEPVLALSGNGVHLLYKVNLNSNDKSKELIRKCLKTLDMLFSYGEKEKSGISIDVSTHNNSRVCKLYGTLAQKGSNTEDRPFRMSKIVKCPEQLKATDIAYLEKLASLFPEEIEKPKRTNNYTDYRDFDVEEWMDKYGIWYKRTSHSDYTKYILDNCPFNSEHKGKDACIFRYRNGALHFHCFHNECSGRTWKDVRLLFEPDAYEKKQSEYESKMYHSFNRNKKVESKPIVEKEGTPIFYTAKEIYDLPKVDEAFIKTGIIDIDKRLRGLKKGYVGVVSGLRASSKSTVLSQISLTAIDEGNNVGIYSGELTAKNFMKWMNLQAAGKGYVQPTQYENYYTTKRETQKLIAEWMENHFWLYNNDYGNDFEAILKEFEKCIDEHCLDLLILDNLMSFNISSLSENKWDAQTQFVLRLQKLAKAKNVAILFVAHPRKAMGFLRLDDISGTGDLANAVDNAFIVHRVNNDFKRLSKQMFNWKDDETIYQATNCIEIAKDRDGGTCDFFAPLYYEKETKRLKNYMSENVIYGWNKEDDGFMQMDLDEDIPF